MFTILQQCERNYVYSYLNFRAKNQQMTRITLQRFKLKKFQISFWPLLFFLVGIFIAWFNDYLAPAGAAHLSLLARAASAKEAAEASVQNRV